MDNFEKQQQILIQKKKWNWKKISVLAGAGAFVLTGTGVITWTLTKEYLQTRNNNLEEINSVNLSDLTYQLMTVDQFNQIHEKFYTINNIYLKKLATEQLMFYLPTASYQEIKSNLNSVNQQTNLDLTPNLSKLLTEKMINSVGSNLRVWGLNQGYAFNSGLVEMDFNLDAWEIKQDKDNKESILFDLKLGYDDSNKTFELKGKLRNSEGITNPIEEFTTKNLAKIFQQANDIFNSRDLGLNRQGYFIGLDFNGEKGPDNEEPELAFKWKGDQTVNLQEFEIQTWDYVLNSLKNYNLVKEDVFVNGLELFNIDGWNPDKIYVGDKSQVKVDKKKNEIRIGKVNDFGPHTIVSKVMVTYKADENIGFEFWGSYLQNSQWGNY